jgi:methyl-accepting chemotaxis protein
VVTQIAASSEQQSHGVQQIGEAISRMDRITQNNAATAEETAASAAAMSDQVQQTRNHLEDLVEVVGLQR